jgi:hypothetical protein
MSETTTSGLRGLSVVIPAVNTVRDVLDCLAALDKERGEVDLEVLLVNRLGAPVREQVPLHFPWARVIEVEPGTTIPRMRAIAFRDATKDAVAVIEDHVMVPQGWAVQMLDALDASQGVVAGSVENAATESLLDWACFLVEYHHLIPPIDAGVVDGLTGNNVVYRRSLLQQFEDVIDEGRWENRLHDAMKEAGIDLICRPEIVIGHKKHYTFGEYFSQRYLYARAYAGARVAEESTGKKLIYGLSAFALPAILYLRVMSQIVSKKKHLGLLALSQPLILCFITSWTVGEIVGYVAGPGDALGRVC